MPGTVLRIVTRLNRGGPLRQLAALVPALPARGWDGPVLAGLAESHEEDAAAALARAGADVHRVAALRRGLEPGADLRALSEILRHVRRVRPDIVHTHLAKAGALGRLAAGLGRVPAVHTFHGHHLQAPWPRDRLARAAERALRPLTRAAICLTPRQRRDLVEIHRVLPAAQVQVIGPGLDVDALQRAADPARAAAIRRAFSPEGAPLLVWAGRFVAVKDPLLLVRAVARSARGFRLVMLGRGPLLPAVRRAVRDAGLAEVIHCPGAVREVAPWVAASDLVVLSSRSEGAAILVVEAKVLARPALVPAVGGLPDLVAHGLDGWWVPPRCSRSLAQALDLLVADRALRERLGAAAAAGAASRFGAARLAEETAALYERVVASSRRRPARRAPRPPREGGHGPRGGRIGHG